MCGETSRRACGQVIRSKQKPECSGQEAKPEGADRSQLFGIATLSLTIDRLFSVVMNSTVIAIIAGVILLVFLLFIAKLAIRWAIRLALAALVIVILAAGGILWWWSGKSATPSAPGRQRPAPTRRSS